MKAAERAPIDLPDSVPLVPPAGFGERLAAVGAIVDEATLARLGDYLARLLAMNERMNLTAIKDAESAWERHILDALTLLPMLAGMPAKSRVVDVGSGGGIPGIPLAIARHDLSVTLVEATQKKCAFLTAVSAAMGFDNLEVRAGRAEELGRDDMHQAFDVCIARAVAKVDALAQLTAPFVKRRGTLLFIKGQRADEELAEAKAVLAKLGLTHVKTEATPTGRIIVLRRS